jgi:hypothetical protein
VAIRSTVNTCHFGIPAIRAEKCQDTNNEEQRISPRFAERSDHDNLTSRDAEIRFRPINVEVTPKRQMFRPHSTRIISTCSIRVASSVSALELLTRFDAGQRCR